MKLLLDENLSPTQIELLADLSPDIVHVRDRGLRSSPDREVWAFAARHGYTIITKDADSHQRSLLTWVSAQSDLDSPWELLYQRYRGLVETSKAQMWSSLTYPISRF